MLMSVATIAVCLNLFAQTNVAVKSSTFEKIELSLKTGRLEIDETRCGNGTFSRVAIDGFLQSTEVGNPELPVLVEMLEIPLCDSVEVRIVSQNWTTVPAMESGLAHKVWPAQPTYPKSYDGEPEFVMNDNLYSANEFYSKELVKVEKLGVARDRNMATLTFSPVSYNPVSGEIRLCTSAEVLVTFVNSDETGTRRMKRLHHSPMFNGMPSLNALPESMDKNEYSSTPVRMLIVAHPSFRGQLDTLVNWKKRKGFITDIVYAENSGAGTTAARISNYLKQQYADATPENPAPTFVLLVGDVAQIPAFGSKISSSSYNDHITDLYYATWTSGDNLPDCHYGRFSAQNLSQLTPQIEKTLMYENCSMQTKFHLDKAVLVSGIDDGIAGDNAYMYADPTVKYIENYYINTANNYSTVSSYYNEDRSNSQANISNIIKSNLSAGFAIANYTAHCSPEGWSDPEIKTSMLGSLSNRQRFGIMIGNCCESNRFDEDECFGEAILRLDNYRGAVGYIGASNSTYWPQDFYWSVGVRSGSYYNQVTGVSLPAYNALSLGMYDCLYHTHNEDFSKWYTTTGGMLFAGNSAVQKSSANATRKTYYWEIYHLMGDPSIMPWLHSPSNMTVTANTSLETGATSLAVTAVPYAYVALTDSSLNLVAATVADASGNATLQFAALPRGDYELAAAAQNYKVKFTGIRVRNPEEYAGIAPIGNFTARTFPNPAADMLFVEAPAMSEITLTDMLGKIVFSTREIDGNRVAISLEEYPKGIYLVCVKNHKGESAHRKVVVKK